MSLSVTIALTLAVLFTANLVKAVVGFGEALIAMPLLSLMLGIRTATPLVGLAAMTMTLLIVGRGWRHVDLTATWRLVLSSAIGLPVGVFLLRTAPERLITGALGLLLIGFGLYSLLRPRLTELKSRHWAYAFGFAGGILGGAYNANGPAIVIYGTLRRWSPERFRVTLQGVFFPTGVLILSGHALGGLWTPRVFQLYALSLPALLLAFWIGAHLHRRIPPARFEKVVHVCLVALGVLILV